MRAPSAKQWRRAAKLLREKRVHVIAHGPHGIAAEVEGDHGTYEVLRREGQWECECDLQKYRPSWACAHIAAVWMVWQALKESETDGTD